jgi:phage terminase large subunit-like protein
MNAARGGFLDLLHGLSPRKQALLIARLSDEEADGAEHDWRSWAHDGQRAPAAGHDGTPCQVIAEANQGGKMVKSILHTADPNLRVKLVTASKGKTTRAEPVVHLFEAGKVVLHGRFPELEAELLGMIAGGGYEGPGRSPDRADAMVWGVTELMLGRRAEARVWVG